MKTWMTSSVLDTFEAADSYRRDMIEAHGKHGADISAYVKVRRLPGERFAVQIGREIDPTIPGFLARVNPDLADSPDAMAILRWSMSAWDPDDLGSPGDPPAWHSNPSGEE